MYDVIAVGSATRDVLVKSKKFKILKDKRFITGKSLSFNLGSKILIDDIYFTTGGAGTNTAVTFARQGFKTSCMVRVGLDTGGEAVKKEMIKEKIDISLLQQDKKMPTAYSVILEPKNGERTILVYRGANNYLSASGLKGKGAYWIYLSSISGNMDILNAAIKQKKDYGTHIAWNPGGVDLKLGLRRLEKYLKYIDVFLVNKEEAAGLLKIPYNQEKKLFKKFDDVIDGVAVMTKGPGGVVASDGKMIWRAGIFKEKRVLDRTGAGDAFGSGFVAGLLRSGVKRGKKITGRAVEEALRVGSANATSKVEMIGTKAGLIRKRDLKNKRWIKLPIKVQQL